MRKRILVSSLVVLMSLVSALPVFAGQWQQDQRGWLYQQDDGNYANNAWVNHGGIWYFVNSAGVMVANQFIDYAGSKYFVDGNGAMAHSKSMIIGDKWYRFRDNGTMVTGWDYTNGKWYYFGGDGTLQVGWVNDSGKTYLCNGEGGAMMTGWQQLGAEWYYFYSDGHMATGVQTVDGVSQLFTSQGVWVKDADTNQGQMTGDAITMDSLFNAAYKGIEWDDIETLAEKYYSNFYGTTVDTIGVLNSWRNSNNSKNLDFSSTLSKAAFALAISNKAEDYLGPDSKTTVGVTEYMQCLNMFDANTEAGVLVTEESSISKAIQTNYNKESLAILCDSKASKIGVGFARRDNGNIVLVVILQ